ncbi:MAG TPA: hypothetical protein VNZ45_08955 [Bacteroidia bacterium]|nr:hypothetical protein [Bacteroidia bacterium]
MSDSLSILCIAAAWYYFEKYRRELSANYLLAFTFFFASAIATRYASIIVLIVPAILITILFLKNFKLSSFILAVIISISLFTPHFLIRGHNSVAFINHEWINRWAPANFFQNHFDTPDGSSSYTFYNLFYSFYNLFHPAFCFAGILFLVTLWGKGKQIKETRLAAILISVLLYAIFLAGIPFQNLRFLLLSLPLVLVIMFPGYIRICEYLTTRKLLKYALAAAIILQLAFFCRVFIPFYNDNKTERQVANRMLQYQNATVYTFSIDGALRGYGFKGNIINMSTVRIDTLKVCDTNSLVLFNTKQFSEQWKDKNPMINWEYLTKKSKLVTLESLPDGWVLYQR